MQHAQQCIANDARRQCAVRPLDSTTLSCRAGYLRFLPKREFLPLFWPDALLDTLAATSVDANQIKADRVAMQDDFDNVVQPFVRKHIALFGGQGECRMEEFLAASSWVSSRAFFVDDKHGALTLLRNRAFLSCCPCASASLCPAHCKV